MMLETNGNMSTTKKTKHIQVRYLFIKGWLENGDVYLKN